jgi:hypothetical protein
MLYDKEQLKKQLKKQRKKERKLSNKQLVSKNCSKYNKTKWIREESDRKAQQKIDKEFKKRLEENSANHKEQTILKIIKQNT